MEGRAYSGRRTDGVVGVEGQRVNMSPDPARGATQSPRRPRRLWVALGAIPVLVGLGAAIRNAWVCDDAFITFRYVDNFARGFGLVYNAGERVEGYTHFLWAILLTAVHRTGIDLVALGRTMPLVFHAATLAVLFKVSLQRDQQARFFWPLAAVCFALHPDAQIWASGGLETMAFTFCVTATVLAASSLVIQPGVVALLAALATLFRPEGVLLSAGVAAVLVWRKPGALALARFAGVWIALVAPLCIWRLAYYHDWLPNTYYAKSAGAANWSHGWHYVVLYFSVYPVELVGFAAAIVVGWLRRHDKTSAALPCAVVSVLLLAYVVRVGGDFMFARFLLPVTPLLYVAIDEVTRRWRPRARVLAIVLVVGATVLSRFERSRILDDAARAQGVADEHAHYPASFIARQRDHAEQVAAIFGDLDVRVCTLGAQACFAYFARFPYVFDRYGLTDREFARRPLQTRGRPGHERDILRRDLIARRVHLFFRGDAKDRTGAIDEAVFGDLFTSVVFYDRALMDALRGRPGVEFVDYPSYLDSMVRTADSMSRDERDRAWAFARGYYFDHNADPERYARARAALSRGE